jgi:hypothetical protein
MFAREQGLAAEFEMRVVGGGDRDELDALVGEHFFNRTVNFRIRVCLRSLIAFALDDGRQFKTGNCGDEGGMKGTAAVSKADYRSANGFSHAFKVMQEGGISELGQRARPEEQELEGFHA